MYDKLGHRGMMDPKNVWSQIVRYNVGSIDFVLQGFGAGNFKALFEAIEADQAARGNL